MPFDTLAALFLSLGAPTGGWDVQSVPDPMLADTTGGARVDLLRQLESDQFVPVAQSTAQDSRTGFDNWFADNNVQLLANSVLSLRD